LGRTRPPLSKRLQLQVFRRDRWMCRWCNRPVIFGPVMRLIERAARIATKDPLSYYHPHWTRADAPLLDDLGAVLDHIEAFSAGGATAEDNLVTSCCKCNVRKNSAPLERWAKRPKHKPVRGKYGEPQYWDGLIALFVALARRDPNNLTASERQWLNLLSRSTHGES